MNKSSRKVALSPVYHPPLQRDDALQFISGMSREFADARHHCWAYLIGDPHQSSQAAYNDNGEPTGTAGRPILNVLQQSGLGNAVVVVVRYFGGIKLGAGGLTRAYSSTAAAAVSEVPKCEFVKRTRLSVQLPYPLESFVRRTLTSAGAEIEDTHYGVDLTIVALIDDRQHSAVIDELRNGSSGTIICRGESTS